MSLIARVRNRNLFQSNVCNLFLTGIYWGVFNSEVPARRELTVIIIIVVTVNFINLKLAMITLNIQ